jgi:hypothetical protein
MPQHFEGQHDDEEVFLVFRRHPIAMRKGFYMLILPFVVGSLPFLLVPSNTDLLWLSVGGLGLGALLFFYYWMGWYFSVFIATNLRLRQVTQKGFFSKSVIDVGVSKIQNISYNIPGFSAALLGYGNLVVQTYVGDLTLDHIHHPGRIYNELQKVVHVSSKDDLTGDYEEASK